jgi:hypothetical protein
MKRNIQRNAVNESKIISTIKMIEALTLICCLTMQNLRITTVGVEVRKSRTGDLHWCLDFRDMDSPGIILLKDVYGRKGSEGGGFVLCPLYGRKCKTFIAASGASNSSILTKMVCAC